MEVKKKGITQAKSPKCRDEYVCPAGRAIPGGKTNRENICTIIIIIQPVDGVPWELRGKGDYF